MRLKSLLRDQGTVWSSLSWTYFCTIAWRPSSTASSLCYSKIANIQGKSHRYYSVIFFSWKKQGVSISNDDHEWNHPWSKIMHSRSRSWETPIPSLDERKKGGLVCDHCYFKNSGDYHSSRRCHIQLYWFQTSCHIWCWFPQFWEVLQPKKRNIQTFWENISQNEEFESYNYNKKEVEKKKIEKSLSQEDWKQKREEKVTWKSRNKENW